MMGAFHAGKDAPKVHRNRKTHGKRCRKEDPWSQLYEHRTVGQLRSGTIFKDYIYDRADHTVIDELVEFCTVIFLLSFAFGIRHVSC